MATEQTNPIRKFLPRIILLVVLAIAGWYGYHYWKNSQLYETTDNAQVEGKSAAGFRNGYLPEIAAPRFNVAAGVGISAPIYSGKRFTLQRQSAQIAYESGQQNLASVQAALQRDLATVLADMESNRQRLQNLQTQTRQADKALELARTRYRYGTLTFPELDTAQTAVEEVQLSRLSIEYSLLLNALEIKRLTGKGL